MAGKTVLVIDTDIETEDQIMATLEAAGYLVFAAQADDVVSEMALKVSPSLMFFSASSPGPRGFEPCRTIHAADAFRDIPIIALTSYDEPMSPSYTSAFGIVDIMHMPFTGEELLSRTERVLAVGGPGSFQSALQEAQKDVGTPKPIAAAAAVAEKALPAAEPLDEDFGHADEIETASVGREDDASVEDMHDYAAEAPRRSRIIIPAVVVGVVLIAGVGLYLYKDMLFGKATVSAVAKKAPVQQQAPEPAPAAPAAPAAPQSEPAKAEPAKPGKPDAPAVEAKSSVPEQKPAAKPSPAPGKPAVSSGKFSVQLGAFRDEAKAEVLAKTLKGKGYDAFVGKSEAKGKGKGAFFRVLVGRYDDRAACRIAAEKIKTKEGMPSVIYSD